MSQKLRQSRIGVKKAIWKIASIKQRVQRVFRRAGDEKDKCDSSGDGVSQMSAYHAFWKPPTMPGARPGEGKTPDTYDPEANLRAYLEPLMECDPAYVTKRSLGPDTSNHWEIWRYDFTPPHYEKTIVITACLHGNEYTGFYALAQFLELLVRDWHCCPALSHLRKNIRLVTVPIVNPWGFHESKRQNVNWVDLNRNFPYNWESYSATQPGDTNYKGPEPLSEAEAKAIHALFQEVAPHTVGYLDFHTIVSVQAEYVLFMPRFAKQNNLPYLRVIRSMVKEGERMVWGTSSLPALTNYIAEKHQIHSVLPEFTNGLVGQTRDSAEMTRAVTWFGNMILEAAKLQVKGPIETMRDPSIKFLRYDRSPGSVFGLDGRYEGKPGAPVPSNRVNHEESDTRMFSDEYAVFGNTSMKMTANNQVVHTQSEIPEMVPGKYYLWTLHYRVKQITAGHWGMFVCDAGGFQNPEQVASMVAQPDLTWKRVGGVFEGRTGGCRLVYGGRACWTGTVFVDGNMAVEITEEEYRFTRDGRLSVEQLMKRYAFEYESNPPPIQVTSESYQTLVPLEHRFNITVPGLLTLEGSLTFSCTQQTEVAFLPLLYQPFAPHFSWGNVSLNPATEIRRTYDIGTHTIPLFAQIPVQVTNVGVSDRTGEAVVRLRGKRLNGTITVENYRARLTFLPISGGMGYEIYDASKRSGMEKTFPLIGLEEGS
ncbi:M14 family metallopeptidase [Desmospora profundinema]|uniref:Peptidase M14 domain-containing protein n=1 Tax=Desmospora profundinema TaxID=1571184 RepID=A0ABU1IJB6_9BACL|nr:M14 family metallopeptidase [Desmospora profundinema]MDR6224084.1 hypothetical protein [Desmospora profundinema]